MIGLYPLTGQNNFLIHAPWFERLSIDLGGGREVVVKSSRGDKDEKIFVKGLRVNGVEWRKNWVEWGDLFEDGGVMEFELGERPSNWFEDVPSEEGRGSKKAQGSTMGASDGGKQSGGVVIWADLTLAVFVAAGWLFIMV
jgi:putative alpha-1,2-mannosidase